MTMTVDFYLDFMSPFAYLAHHRLLELMSQYRFELAYKPIDLPRAKLEAGNTGPPNVKIPPKIRYLMVDLKRWADRYGLPLTFPKSLNSELMNKGLFYAIDHGQAENYVAIAGRETWGVGKDPADEAVLRGLADQMQWSSESFMAFIHSKQAVDRYEIVNREAHRIGVFGVPMMVVGENMWWGNDRIAFLEEYLQAAGKEGDAVRNAAA